MTATLTGSRAPAPPREAQGFPLKRDVPLLPVSTTAGRALVTVIAIMTFLAAMTAGAAILVAGASREWQQSVAREVTIQVQPVPGRDTEAEVTRTLAIARATPGLTEVSATSEADAQKLLEPWLGTGLDLHDLPIPRLVVARLAPGSAPDLAALRAALADVPDASLDDHRLWVERLAAMANTVVAVAAVVFALVMIAMSLAVAFATLGVMSGNREIIGILHFVGAEDAFIAREFQRHFLRLGLQGGAIGGGAAGLTFLGAGALSAAMASTPGGDQLAALFGSFALGLGGYAAIAAIAFVIAFATAIMSRTIVFRHLSRLD